MNRALPEFNRVIHKRQMDFQKKMHKDKLRDTSPMIDNAVPAACNFPLSKGKK
jgi:hypothetical protein